MRKRTWVLWAIGLVAVAGVLLAAVWQMLPPVQRAQQARMRSAAEAQLRACRTLADVRALPKEDALGGLAIRTFEGNRWLAIRWHCAHDYESGWDGAVLKDNDGRIFWTDHHFCGQEGFESQFVHAEAGSPDEYYQDSGLKLVRLN